MEDLSLFTPAKQLCPCTEKEQVTVVLNITALLRPTQPSHLCMDNCSELPHCRVISVRQK